MKEENYDGTFLGYPLMAQDASEEDCRRTDWEAKINGRWHQVNVGSLGDEFRGLDAAKTIIRVLQSDYDTAMKLVANWEFKYARAIAELAKTLARLKDLESDQQSQEEIASSMRNE
jgi:lipid A disaccharide synthetase